VAVGHAGLDCGHHPRADVVAEHHGAQEVGAGVSKLFAGREGCGHDVRARVPGTWGERVIGLVGVLMPGLRRMASRLTRDYPGVPDCIDAAVLAGFIIGAVNSELSHLQAQHNVTWVTAGAVAAVVPLMLILAYLVVRGRPLPSRGSVITQTLGRAPRPRVLAVPAVLGCTVGAFGLFLTSGNTRAALTTSIILAIISLSLVVVTGFAGQISLAQVTLAGAGAFALNRLTVNIGVPFPIAPILAGLVAMVIGVAMVVGVAVNVFVRTPVTIAVLVRMRMVVPRIGLCGPLLWDRECVRRGRRRHPCRTRFGAERHVPPAESEGQQVPLRPEHPRTKPDHQQAHCQREIGFGALLAASHEPGPSVVLVRRVVGRRTTQRRRFGRRC